jgi:hypothetical protein
MCTARSSSHNSSLLLAGVCSAAAARVRLFDRLGAGQRRIVPCNTGSDAGAPQAGWLACCRSMMAKKSLLRDCRAEANGVEQDTPAFATHKSFRDRHEAGSRCICTHIQRAQGGGIAIGRCCIVHLVQQVVARHIEQCLRYGMPTSECQGAQRLAAVVHRGPSTSTGGTHDGRGVLGITGAQQQ